MARGPPKLRDGCMGGVTMAMRQAACAGPSTVAKTGSLGKVGLLQATDKLTEGQ